MKYLAVTLTTVLSLLSYPQTQAATTTQQYIQRLKKTSDFIRGPGTLTQTEIDELKAAIKSGSADSYIKTQTRKYLTTEEHVNRMSSRLEQMFGVQTYSPYLHSQIQPSFLSDFQSIDNYNYYNSLNALFREIARSNLSWDQLLVGKEYYVYPMDTNRKVESKSSMVNRISDEMFFNQVRTEANVTENLIENPKGTIQLMSSHNGAFPPPSVISAKKYVFGSDNPKVAGAITTSRFFERYPNSSINRNRKRAAAIFRIFMCDSMVPFAGGSASMKNLDDFIPELVSNDADLPHGSEEDLHGSRPDCQSCHYKLDPMGKTMLPTTRTLSRISSAGNLTYRNSAGELINIRGKGIGAVAKGITEQSDYVSCQVNRFVHWFFGSSNKIGFSRYKQIIAEFNKLDRKTNDFIAYLVEQPEFFDSSFQVNPNVVLANQVKNIFQVCSNCHGTDTPSAMGYAPNLVETFFKGDVYNPKLQVEYVADAIKLENNCTNAYMPPKSSGWKLTTNECQAIKNWIKAGIPDLDGNPRMEVSP